MKAMHIFRNVSSIGEAGHIKSCSADSSFISKGVLGCKSIHRAFTSLLLTVQHNRLKQNLVKISSRHQRNLRFVGTSVQIHLVSLTAIVDVFALQFYVYVMLLQNLPVQLHCVFPLFIQHSFCIHFFIPHFARVRQSKQNLRGSLCSFKHECIFAALIVQRTNAASFEFVLCYVSP